MAASAPAAAPREPSRPDDGVDEIRDRTRIAALLGRLHEERRLVTVFVDEDRTPGNSAVLGVDSAAGTMVMDELTPRAVHERVRPGSVLRADAALGGVRLRFRWEVARVEVDEGIALYRGAIPRTLDYHQRRGDFRAHVGPGRHLRVWLDVGPGDPLVTELNDLSASGCSVRYVAAETDAGLAVGRPVGSRLELPNGDSLRCRFVPCHQCEDEFGARVIGGRLIDLDRRRRVLLRRVVAEIEREALRSRVR